jgi:UTP--glucose-1-phosphate uridylyltransferase
MIDVFEARKADAVIAFEEVPEEDVVQYGIARPAGELGAVFEVADLIEKPARAEAPSRLAIAARYVCGPAIFDFLERTQPGKGGEIQFTDAFRLLLKEGGKVLGVCLRPGETRYDIGNFDSYFQSFVAFALADPQYGPALREYVRKLIQ